MIEKGFPLCTYDYACPPLTIEALRARFYMCLEFIYIRLLCVY